MTLWIVFHVSIYIYSALNIYFVFKLVFVALTIGDDKSTETVDEDLKLDMEMSVRNGENSAVFDSLPLAIKWIRDSVQQNKSVRFQVMLLFVFHLVNYGSIFT